jgi:iron complex outermembrane recepter protein
MLVKHESILTTVASFVALTGLHQAAVAQDQAESGLVLEEIVVSAQKRQESVLEVPVAVTAFAGDEISKRGLTDFGDLAGVTPGVFLTTSGSSRATRINIRGITSTPTSIGFEPGISVTVDGVAQGRSTTFNNEFLDIESIEILRGPQGTLYGRNSVAGAINIYTKKPTVDAFEGSAKVSIGNFGAQMLSGSINVPMGDKVALRLSGYTKERDGYLENITTGDEHNNIDRTGFRGSLLFEPTDNLDFILRASTTDLDMTGNTFEPVDVPGDISLIDRKIASNFRDFQERETSDASIEVNWSAASGYEFKSITAYAEYDFKSFNDVDRSNVDSLATGIDEGQQQFSQEFQISSPLDGVFSWIAGLYYFDQDLYANAIADFGTEFFVPAFAGMRVNAYFADVETEAIAVFGQGELKLSDHLTLIAGLRYTEEEKSVDYDQQNIFAAVFTSAATIKDSEPTGTLKLKYQTDHDVTYYVSYSRGFKAGGFNLAGDLPSSDPALLLVEPEYVDTAEVGMRGRFLDGRLQTTLTGYVADYQDRQVFDLDNSGVIPTLVSLNRSTNAQGIELEAQYAASDTILVGGSYGYLDAEVDSSEPAFDGNVVERSPENQFTLYGEYTLWFNEYDVLFRADYSYIGEWYDEDENFEAAKQDAYDLINLRVILSPGSDRWSTALWAKNVTDEDYALDFLAQNGADGGAIAPNIGRTFGVDFQYNFGN